MGPNFNYLIYHQIYFISECGPPKESIKEANYGKRCPGNVGYDQKKDPHLELLFSLDAKNPKCLNGNKGYTNLNKAWEACGKIPECGFIFKDMSNYYFLRRWSDPNLDPDKLSLSTRFWGYNYDCRKYVLKDIT